MAQSEDDLKNRISDKIENRRGREKGLRSNIKSRKSFCLDNNCMLICSIITRMYLYIKSRMPSRRGSLEKIELDSKPLSGPQSSRGGLTLVVPGQMNVADTNSTIPLNRKSSMSSRSLSNRHEGSSKLCLDKSINFKFRKRSDKNPTKLQKRKNNIFGRREHQLFENSQAIK